MSLTPSLAYRDQLDALVHRSDALAQDAALLRPVAASHGHLQAMLRAEDFAQKLAIELSELRMVLASEFIMGRAA